MIPKQSFDHSPNQTQTRPEIICKRDVEYNQNKNYFYMGNYLIVKDKQDHYNIVERQVTEGPIYY